MNCSPPDIPQTVCVVIMFVGALMPIGLQAISEYHANGTMVMVSYEPYHIYIYEYYI